MRKGKGGGGGGERDVGEGAIWFNVDCRGVVVDFNGLGRQVRIEFHGYDEL